MSCSSSLQEKRGVVKSIETFNAPAQATLSAPSTAGFTLNEQIYIKRGELAVKAGEKKPTVTSRVKTSLFWLGKKPMILKKEYYLKLGCAKVPVRLEEVLGVINADSLEWNSNKNKIERLDVAESILSLSNPIAFDTYDENPLMSRFVIVDEYEISGGGIIREGLDDSKSWIRDNVYLRNYKWEKSGIPVEHRADRYNQKSALILITGLGDHVERGEAVGLRVVGVPARHAVGAEPVLDEERGVEADEQHPEVDLARASRRASCRSSSATRSRTRRTSRTPRCRRPCSGSARPRSRSR